jgi:antitoxin component of RelBE/YafQ-DinJ toxin-antitoxin module
MGTQKNNYIHIRIDDKLKTEFMEYCDTHCITPSKIIRKLIKDKISNEETNK